MRIIVTGAAFALLMGAAFAHHGWGSYDAAKPVTVAGPILTSKFENPHAIITVRGADKTWTVTLAPTSRMVSRGATQSVVAIGNNISAYGYPSTVRRTRCVPSGSPWTARPTRCADDGGSAGGFRCARAVRLLPRASGSRSWLYPAANVGHIVSLTFLAGALAVMDVRLLGGFAATEPAPMLARARLFARRSIGGNGDHRLRAVRGRGEPPRRSIRYFS